MVTIANALKSWSAYENQTVKNISYWVNSFTVLFFGLFILTPVNTLGITSSLLILSSLLYLMHSPKLLANIRNKEVALIALAFVLYAIYNFVISEAIRGSMTSGQTRQASSMILWILMLVYIRHTGFSAKAFWAGLSLGTVIGFYTSIMSIANNVDRVSRELSAFNPIFWGIFATLQCTLLACLCYYYLKSSKWIFACGTALLSICALVSIIASGSRGSLIALAVTAIMTPLLISKNKKKSFSVAIFSLVALVACIKAYTTLLPESGLSNRMQLAVTESKEYFNGDMKVTSVGLRLQMWAIGFEAIKKSPIFGNPRSEINKIKDNFVQSGKASTGVLKYPHLHNDYINTAANLGIIGLILLLFIYISISFNALNYQGFQAMTVISAVGVLLGTGLTDSVFASGRGTMTLLVILLIVLGLKPFSANKSAATSSNC